MKALLKGAGGRKQERSQNNNITLQFKKLEKEELNSKLAEKKETTKIRASLMVQMVKNLSASTGDIS